MARMLICLALCFAAPTARAAACACSGEVGANDARRRADYGTRCGRWDAADESPWCVVASGACGEEDTFQSGPAHFWAHKPCHGEGDAYVPPTPGGGGGGGGAAAAAQTGGAGAVGARFLAGMRAECALQQILPLAADTTCVARPEPGKDERGCMEAWRPHSMARCLRLLRGFDFGAPSPSTCKEQLFHAFWGTGTLRDSEWMCIDSFRATQRSCARLIVWFGKKAALEEHAAKHAAALDPARRPAVEFRLLDVAAVRELARGSAVAHYSEVQLREIKDQQRLGMSQW